MSFSKPLSRSVDAVRCLGWILCLSFIGMTFIPRSLDHTLFDDGLAYASISRNMAMGLGTFWKPYFADSFWLPYNRCSYFCEHPPLMFGIQACLFWLFGDSTWVENLYNLIILLISIILINGLWKELTKNRPDLRIHAWLPVLLWYGLKVVWSSVPNNFLDSTLSVFCLAACYFQLRSFHSKTNQRILLLVLSGIMIVLALLTKGPVGLYPLSFPFLYWVVFQNTNFTKCIENSLIPMITVLIIGYLIFLYPPATDLLSNYFEGQVIDALQQKRERIRTDWTAHFYILLLLIKHIIPHLILITVFWLLNSRAKISKGSRNISQLAFLTTCSIVLPICLSVKQYDHYLVPALPFVGILFSSLLIENLMQVYSKFSRQCQSSFVVLTALFCCIGAQSVVNLPKDRMYEVSMNLSKNVPPRAKVYLPKDISMCSDIHAPFQRYASLSIAFNPNETDYLLFDNPNDPFLKTIIKKNLHELIDIGQGFTLAKKR